MRELVRETRIAIRSLARARAFTGVAVAVLALGIGSTAAVYSVFDAILLNPLPYEGPEQLVVLWIDDPEHGVTEEGFGYPTYVDWRDSNRVFVDVAACLRDWKFEVRVGESFDRQFVNFTTANLPFVLGVEPAFGRWFTPREDEEGAGVAVVSAAFAQRFGGGPEALGAAIEIEGEPYEIVGVTRAGFGFPHPDTVAWIPWPAWRALGRFRAIRETDQLLGIARLKPGVTFEAAERDLDEIGVRLAQRYPPSRDFAGYDANVVPLLDQITGAELPRLLRLMLAGVGLLFVIACVNVMNLFIVRNEARSSDAGIRRALGASGWALRKQRVIEALLVSGLGLAGAVGVATILVAVFVAAAPANIPRIESARVDPAVFAVATALALLAALAATLAPSRARSMLQGARAATTSVASRRLQNVFVTTQAAMALVLLCGMALFAKSFMAALELDPGYRRGGVLFATLDYRQGLPEPIHGELVRRLAGYPGVEQIGGTTSFQIALNPDNSIRVRGRAEPERIPLAADTVTPGYFEAMGVPLLRGRMFTEADLGKKLALINASMARQVWPNEDPIGAVIEAHGNPEQVYEIVGVVGDMRRRGLEREPIAQMFRPAYTTVMTLAVRTSADYEQLGGWIRETYAEISPTSVPVRIESVESVLDRHVAPRRFYTLLLVGFAMLALLITAGGLFGLMAYTVERRTREIGVRVAVGARPVDVAGLLLRDAMRLVAVGSIAGMLGIVWMSDRLNDLLFETTSPDVASMVIAAALLGAAGLFACAVPIRRSMRVDPVSALRSE